jgi:hypothetical protein
MGMECALAQGTAMSAACTQTQVCSDVYQVPGRLRSARLGIGVIARWHVSHGCH